MENKLTPTKIMRLMSLAESKTPDQRWRETKNIPDMSTVSVEFSDINPSASSTVRNLISAYGPDSKNVESSLGLLDLDGCEDLLGSQLAGTCSIADMSVKSSMFNPKEMTGRSTDGLDGAPADDVSELTARLRAQSGNVAALIEQSFVDDKSFMSARKIDLTAEEVSCIQNHGTLPIPLCELDMNLTKNIDRKLNDTNVNGVDLSMGSYFKKKTFGLESILAGSGSPQNKLSLLHGGNQMNQTGVITINDTQSSDCVVLDATLDQVPVKEPAPVFKAPQVQHFVAQQNINGDESSMVDTSLSASLIAKWLCKMDLKATPSTLLAEVQRNKENFATAKQNTKTAKFPVKNKVVRQIDKSTLNNIAGNQANDSPVPIRASKNSHASSDHSTYVSTLQLCGKTDTASSDSTVDTVITRPAITVTNATVIESESDFDIVGKTLKSSNPRTSTRCQNESEDDLICMTSPIVDVGSCKKDLGSASGILPSKSPMGSEKSNSDLEYKELDKSINWPDILPNKDYDTEKWVQVDIEDLEAFIGVCTSLKIKLTSLTERWLSVRFELDKMNEPSVKLETTIVPILLRPGETQSCSFATTVVGQIKGPVTLVVIMQDTCSDDEIFIKKNIKISNRLPQLQILSDLKMSNEKVVKFPDVQEKRNCCKIVMIKSDCEADLQLVVAVSGDHNSFSINSVDVVDCVKIKECLGTENRLVNTEGRLPNKQYRPASACKRARCILPRNAALHLTLSCSAPLLSVFKQRTNQVSLEGTLSIYTAGGNICIKEVKLTALVGIVRLQFKHPSNSDEINFQTGQKQKIELSNTGTIESTWRIVVRKELNGPETSVFSATPTRVTLGSGHQQSVEITYHGPDDVVNNGFLILENTTDGQNSVWKLVGGQDKPKVFPIKTTHNELAWGRPGPSKSIRLKNTSRHRVKVQCTVCGDGFRIDGDLDSKGIRVYSLEPNEIEELPISFVPNGVGLYYAKLMLILMDKPYLAKAIRLFASGGSSIVRWARSVPRGPSGPALLTLCRGATSCELLNKGDAPAFVSAQINFNWRFASLKPVTVVRPAKAIVAPGARLMLTLEMEARTLAWVTRDVRDGVLHIATLSLLVGDDCTRRRINRLLEKGERAPSEQLSRIVGKFDGENDQVPTEISLLNESARSLEVLTTELEELTAEITLSRDTLEDQTILVSDDTTVHYHTLCDDHTIVN